MVPPGRTRLAHRRLLLRLRELPPDAAARLASPLGDLCTPEARATFVSFYGDRAPRYLGGAKRYTQALESIDLCIAAISAAASR